MLDHDPVMLAMLLTLLLQLQASILGVVGWWVFGERSMVSITRFLDLKNIPQEVVNGTIPIDIHWPRNGSIVF